MILIYYENMWCDLKWRKKFQKHYEDSLWEIYQTYIGIIVYCKIKLGYIFN
jgi:hypothetical protein